MKEKNRKLKVLSLILLVFSCLLFVGVMPAVALEQRFSIDPTTSTEDAGGSITFAVNYSIENDANSGAFNAQLFFNPNKVTFVEFTNIDDTKPNTGIDNVPVDDTDDIDNNPLTTKYVGVNWFDMFGAIPGTPRKLYDVTFTVNANAYNGVTAINVDCPASTLDLGNTLVSQNLALTITGGNDAPSTPVLLPVTGFYKDEVSVTATIDASPITTYYTIDGTDPDNTDTLYAGAFNVDGNDGDEKTVKMISYDSSEPIYGDIGSAVYTFDKAVPTGTYTAPTADEYVKLTALTISGTAADTGSDVDKVEVSINGGTDFAVATGTATWTYTAALVNGANAIVVKVTDKAGNVATLAGGNTITYYPPLALTVGGTDVTGTTVYVPNTDGSNTKTITVSGGSGDFANYTWLPLTEAGVGALSAGTTDAEKIYTADLDVTGTHAVTIQDPTAASVFTAAVTFEVVDFSVTNDTTGYVGEPIVFTAQGNVGEVAWEVEAGADVAGTPVISGNMNTIATVTPLKAGTFQLEAEDTGVDIRFDTPVVTVYTVPDFTDLPIETTTVQPGADSAEFSVSGGSETYTWAVAGPSAVAGGTGATYTFPAPDTGSFAGTYTITVEESASYSKSFTVYVPLTIEPTTTFISIMSDASAQPFTLTGAADPTPYTATVENLEDPLMTYTPVTAVFSSNTASYAFDPSDYSVTTDTQEFSLDFAVQGLDDPPLVTMSIVPVMSKDFIGTIVKDSNGDPLSGVTVTITSPAAFKGLTQTTDAQGEFTFAGLTVLDISVLGFKAELTQYVSETFTSDDLANPIKLADAGASISGTTGAQANVTLFGAAGVLAGPMDTAGDGSFTFEFSDPSAYDYTITASASGTPMKYGDASFTADSATYTPVVNIVLEDVVNPGNLPGSTAVNAGAPEELAFVVGAKTLNFVISPVPGGGVVEVASPVATDVTDTTAPITSGYKWEIDGLGDHCVTISVPCSLADAIAVAEGTKVVRFKNSDTPDKWQTATVDKSKINYAGDNSSIEAVICDWSSNIVGIGAAASSSDGTSDDSSSCFIGSLSASGNSGAMMAWISIGIILVAGIVLRTNKKRKLN